MESAIGTAFVFFFSFLIINIRICVEAHRSQKKLLFSGIFRREIHTLVYFELGIGNSWWCATETAMD